MSCVAVVACGVVLFVKMMGFASRGRGTFGGSATTLFLVAIATWVASASCASKGPCRYNSDCTAAYCSNGECKKDCVDSALDCPKGSICNAVAQCESTTDGGLVDGAPHDDGGADVSSPDVVGGDATADASSDSSFDVGTDGSTGTRRELDLCADDSECKSGLVCRAIFKGSPNRCTRRCTSSATCMSGTACVQVGAENICVWNDVGRTCSTASTCQFACLTSQGYCTNTCADAHDCPNGYGCMPVQNTRVCVKAEVECGSGTSQCIASSACDATMLVSGCTLACGSAADCPQRAVPLAAWTCDGQGICRRPADVYGPLGQGAPAEYACTAQSVVVNVCNDAQHIDFTQFNIPSPPQVSCSATMTTPGVAGDKCVDSCRYQGGCAYGYACTALGSVGGSRIGLCLPALGAGEVGANCSTDGDCLFGYCVSGTGKCSRDCSRDTLCPTGSRCVAQGGPAVEGFAFSRCE